MRLPLNNPRDKTSVDLEQLEKMVDAFLDADFRYFDTAYMYHNFQSEVFIRKALVERHPREKFMLTTKLPLSRLKSVADRERIFNEQLEKCGVDYFDCYLLHNVNSRSLPIAEQLDCFDFIARKKSDSKVRRIAFSFHDRADMLDRILTAHPEIDLVQLQINYLDWESPSVQSRLCYETVRRHGKKIIVMEPIKGGMLARVPESIEKLFKEAAPDMSTASWALRYAASLDGVAIVLSGMSSIEQLEDNVNCMREFKPLNDVEFRIVERAARMIKEKIAIDCTACGYCVKGCPKNIPIPDYFALYNSYFREHGSEKVNLFFNERNYYANYVDNGKASECIGCRQCERACPQHLPITDWLAKVAELFGQ